MDDHIRFPCSKCGRRLKAPLAHAGKRARYSPFLAEVNKEIARTHDDYGQVEDDTIFFWVMSATPCR